MLPRGAITRDPAVWEVDVRGQYGRAFGKNLRVEVFADIFNLFNRQDQTDVDERYTSSFVNPIVGGDMEDLAHSKTLAGVFGSDINETPVVNKNFGNLSARQSPLSMRFGLRVTF
jgi:hypothetical protein